MTEAPRIVRLAHANLSIDDVDAARVFYGEVLGLTPAPRVDEAGRAGLWFRLGAIEIDLSVEEGADNRGSKRHLAFEVEDLDAWRSRLAESGAVIEEGRPVAGMRRFFARDPAGNRLELYTRG